MPRVGFEPTIPVFERAEAVHALGRAATVICVNIPTGGQNNGTIIFSHTVPNWSYAAEAN
jgi:hypothetical protein